MGNRASDLSAPSGALTKGARERRQGQAERGRR